MVLVLFINNNGKVNMKLKLLKKYVKVLNMNFWRIDMWLLVDFFKFMF